MSEQVEQFADLVDDFCGSDFTWASKAEDRTALWSMRHNAYYACLALRKGAVAVVTDAYVPISELADQVQAAADDIAASTLIGPILGHVGDGNFHSALLIEPGNDMELAEAKRLAHRMAERALEVGGTVTGEHGIGIGKKNFMPREHGQAGWEAMGAVKAALDPKGILNPDKLVP